MFVNTDSAGSVKDVTGAKNVNVYDLIDESISELLHLGIKGQKRVEIVDVIQLLMEIDEAIPEIIIDGDEFVKHFSKKRH